MKASQEAVKLTANFLAFPSVIYYNFSFFESWLIPNLLQFLLYNLLYKSVRANQISLEK